MHKYISTKHTYHNMFYIEITIIILNFSNKLYFFNRYKACQVIFKYDSSLYIIKNGYKNTVHIRAQHRILQYKDCNIANVLNLFF